MQDYVVYTRSDPDAGVLEEELEREGFVCVESPSDAAMVVVADVGGKTKSLPKTLRGIARREGITYWKLSKVGKSEKI